MDPEIVSVALGFLAGTAVMLLFFRLYRRIVQERMLVAFERWKDEHTAGIRKDSVNRSRLTLKGKISEQIAPFLPGFPFRPADARFLGNPVDFVVFDGYTEARDGRGEEIRIVFVEIKNGTGRLSPGERLIRAAVEARRVSWLTINLANDETGDP